MQVLNLGDLDRWSPPPPDATRIVRLQEVSDRIISRFTTGPSGERLPWETASEDLRFGEGHVTIWAGAPASFKSTVLSQVVLGFAEQKARTVVTTLEEPIEEYGHRISCQGCADAHPSSQRISEFHRATDPHLLIWDVQGYIQPARVLKMMLYCAQELGAKHFVFDNVTKVIDPSNEASATQWRFINDTHSMARMTKMHIHLVMHSRKQGREGGVPTMTDIRGSSSSSDLADQIIMTWRNRDKEDVQKGTSELPDKEQKQLLTRPDVVINIEKAKFGGREGKLGLWRDIPTRLFFHGSILNPKPTKLLLT